MLGQDHYIYRLRAACILQPEYNRHQLAALDRELALSLAAATPEAHLAASGDMLELARATELDRAANSLATARRHDDPWTAAAAAIEYRHACHGANHGALYTQISIGHQRAAPLRALAATIQTSFARLFFNLLHVHTSNFELDSSLREIEFSFQTLRHSDPAFQPETWLAQPRYRRRLPWEHRLVHQWLAPYWDSVPAKAPEIPADPGDIVQPGGFGLLPWPAAQPLESSPDTTMAGVYLARQAEWPDEFLQAFWRESREQLLHARSPIAQAAITTERESLFSIESTRQYLQLATLLSPLRATANHGWEGSEESREGLEKALATSQHLTGLTYPLILALPRIRHFLENNLAPRLELGNEGFGALNGEAGFDLLRHAYPWQAVRGSVDFYA